ncbi:hypothetical protein RclHR1_10290001 [Rhizophagus clarus]|uniref:Uncharacterized protein n=1 Tax=Rhizophagus clarus TaxID=94130 RepID=A0A2Z6QD02_9GLOM|nr:hypothetical protein RclHR1_10290001 [Rhizophagus clarus]GES95390.1 hypothetical protein GLOIN_2v1779544 [Rhizophagus clarus]
MSSKNYESNRRINLSNDNSRKRTRRKLSCSDCKDTTDCVKLLSNKVTRVEEIINNFKNRDRLRKKPELSIFNAKFTLNNLPYDLEYDLSNFSLEYLLTLAKFTTQGYDNNIIGSSNSSDKNEEK